MADLPQHVDLRRSVVGLLVAEQVEGGVVHCRGGRRPVDDQADACRKTGAFQVPLKGPREVEIAPEIGVPPLRRADPDADAAGGQPFAEQPLEQLATAGPGEVADCDALRRGIGDPVAVGFGRGDDDIEVVEVPRARRRDPGHPDLAAGRLADIGLGIARDDDIGVDGALARPWAVGSRVDDMPIGRAGPEPGRRVVAEPRDTKRRERPFVRAGHGIAEHLPRESRPPAIDEAGPFTGGLPGSHEGPSAVSTTRRVERIVVPAPSEHTPVRRHGASARSQAAPEVGVGERDRARVGAGTVIAARDAARLDAGRIDARGCMRATARARRDGAPTGPSGSVGPRRGGAA